MAETMGIAAWVATAPLEILELFQSVTVLNFLRRERHIRFQMIGAYDGAMSEACKSQCRRDYKAVREFVEALEQQEASHGG